MVDHITKINCKICNNNSLKNSTFKSSKYGSRNIIYCDICDHYMDLGTYEKKIVEQGGIPNIELTVKDKDKGKLQKFINSRKIYLNNIIEKLKKQGMNKEKETINFMDFGCGGGEVVLAGNDIFNKSHGINLDKEHFNYNLDILENKDNEISNLVYDSIDKINMTYDVVISWHVLEHFENPEEFVNIIKKLLNGYLFIQIPTLIDTGIAPNHYNYFTDKSIKILFEKYGFKTLKSYYTDNNFLNYIAEYKY